MADRYLQTGQLIVQDVLSRAGEPTDLTGSGISDYLTDAKKYVQRVYYDILEYAPWPWALKDPPGVLTVYAKVTGTATVMKDSATVTLAATVATSKTGWWFQASDEQVPYRIAAHTAGTAAVTIDAPYNESSGTVSYTMFKDEYSLASDCLKPWYAWNRNRPTEVIDIINKAEMQDRYPFRYHSGTNPKVMAIVKGNKVRIRPWPESSNITVEYDYTVVPSADFTFDGTAGTDTPVVPLQDRHVISDAATVQLLLLKNDSRANEVTNILNGKLSQMVASYLTGTKARMYVKRGGGVWK